jgi:hypothetical protein
MKIGILVNEAGDVIAALLPTEERRYGEDPPGKTRITPAEGQTLREVDIPDEMVPTVPGPEFGETLRRLAAQSAAT